MTMDSENLKFCEALNDSILPMTFDEVKERLLEAYGKPYDNLFHSLGKIAGRLLWGKSILAD